VTRGKTSTGIVGLAVEPEAKAVLTRLYAQTLTALQAVPEDAEYRKMVEGLTKSRLAVVQGSDDLLAIEKTIGGGQAEQLIQQAKDELSLIPRLIAASAFDPYDGSPAEEIYTDLKRRGVVLQRDDIPMRPSQDYPIESEVDLELPAPPEDK
jgi:NADH dehydrogenase (ubiquinone) 1 alpha subcomplex subunit 5